MFLPLQLRACDLIGVMKCKKTNPSSHRGYGKGLWHILFTLPSPFPLRFSFSSFSVFFLLVLLLLSFFFRGVYPCPPPHNYSAVQKNTLTIGPIRLVILLLIRFLSFFFHPAPLLIRGPGRGGTNPCHPTFGSGIGEGNEPMSPPLLSILHCPEQHIISHLLVRGPRVRLILLLLIRNINSQTITVSTRDLVFI